MRHPIVDYSHRISGEHVTEIKVCGLTRMADVDACVRAGVDALGLNFWPGTPRRVDLAFAREVVEACSCEVVGVFVDADIDTIRRVREHTGLRWVQLHGDETPEDVEALLPHAYKAVGVPVSGEVDVASLAERFLGERLLVDARVPGAMPGGTGARFDWRLATSLARSRVLTLAGGLDAGNVAEAIAIVRPARVDVASGVEDAPGLKSVSRIREFVAAVRGCGL